MTTSTVSENVERRRSQRVHVAIPVEVTWTTKEGTRISEHAETEVVSAHGALLRVKTHHPIAAELIIVNLRTGQSAQAKAVCTDSTAGGTIRLAVGLDTPAEALWGISIPRLPAS